MGKSCEAYKKSTKQDLIYICYLVTKTPKLYPSDMLLNFFLVSACLSKRTCELTVVCLTEQCEILVIYEFLLPLFCCVLGGIRASYIPINHLVRQMKV